MLCNHFPWEFQPKIANMVDNNNIGSKILSQVYCSYYYTDLHVAIPYITLHYLTIHTTIGSVLVLVHEFQI